VELLVVPNAKEEAKTPAQSEISRFLRKNRHFFPEIIETR